MDRADARLALTYVIVRCNRWGTYMRWMQSGRALAPPSVGSWWQKLMRDRVQDGGQETFSACPIDQDEAAETLRCVAVLPRHLLDTCMEEYVFRGVQAQKAEALGITTRAYRMRLAEIHGLLLDLFGAAAAGLPLTVEPKRGGPKPVQM